VQFKPANSPGGFLVCQAAAIGIAQSADRVLLFNKHFFPSFLVLQMLRDGNKLSLLLFGMCGQWLEAAGLLRKEGQGLWWTCGDFWHGDLVLLGQ
jgi:hypothetical protein